MDLVRYGKTEDQSITEDDVINTLENACYKYGLENGLKDIKENTTSIMFNNVLLKYVGDTLFKPLKPFKLYNGINSNIYNKDKIIYISDYYINLCNIYDKQITLDGFLYFIGLNLTYLDKDVNDPGLSSAKTMVGKKLLNADDIQQQARARDSKQAILNLAYNNYVHTWDGRIKAQNNVAEAQTLEDIRSRLRISGGGSSAGEIATGATSEG